MPQNETQWRDLSRLLAVQQRDAEIVGCVSAIHNSSMSARRKCSSDFAYCHVRANTQGPEVDPITTSVVTGIASGMLANFSTDAVKQFFSQVFKEKPELEERLIIAKTSDDIEALFKEAVALIDANATTGHINVDGGLLQALRGIRFDHAHGTVSIAGTSISSPVLVTGGGNYASGKTVIGGNTVMKSDGTSIYVGNGCSIVMTGGARIKQT